MESDIDMAQQIIPKDSFSLDEFISKKDIEFVCIINKQGKIDLSIHKSGLNLSEDKKEIFAMGVQLQNSMQCDFDYELGPVNYTITERENARLVSIPTKAGIVLAKLDKSADPLVFVNKITILMSSSKISFESVEGVKNG